MVKKGLGGEEMKIKLTATFIYDDCGNPEDAQRLLNDDLDKITFPQYSASYVNLKSVILEL